MSVLDFQPPTRSAQPRQQRAIGLMVPMLPWRPA